MGDPITGRLRTAGCVFAEQEAALLRSAASGEALEALVGRRVGGEPLEYLLGWVGFGGRRLAVSPGVFVPRRRTELLASLAADALLPGGVLVELCCGVAPVAAAVAAAAVDPAVDPAVEVYACDIDPAAVECARRNIGPGRALLGDLFEALPAILRGRVDVLVANAPYVPSEEVDLMPREARLYEDRVALDGGADGLDVQRRIAQGAPVWLAAGGVVVIETSRRQADASAALLRDVGLCVEVVRDHERDATAVRAVHRRRRKEPGCLTGTR